MATKRSTKKAPHNGRPPPRVLEGTAGRFVQPHPFSKSKRQVLQRALGPRLEEHPRASEFIDVVAKRVDQYLHQGKTVPLRHTRDRLLRALKATDEMVDLDPEDVDFLEPWLDLVLAQDPDRKLDLVESRERFATDIGVYRVALSDAIKNIRPSRSAKVSQQNKVQLIVLVALAYKGHFADVPSADGVFGDFIEQLGNIIGDTLGKRFVRSVLKPLR